MTDTTSETEAADVLTTKQQRRMIAMHSSKELLTLPASSGGVFTASTSRAAVDTGDYVDAIIQLSDYMLHGTQQAIAQPVRGFGIGIPAGLISALFGPGEDEVEDTDEVFGDPEATPDVEPEPDPRRAGHDELIRHAEKQGISYADAFSYFEREGYIMTEVRDLEFDRTQPTTVKEG